MVVMVVGHLVYRNRVKEVGAASGVVGGRVVEDSPCAREVVGLHTATEGLLGCA